MRILLAVLLISLPQAVGAQESHWRLVDSNDHWTIEMDSATLVQNGSSYDVWFRNTFSTPRKMNTTTKLMSSNNVRLHIECANMQFKIMAFSAFDGGDVIYSLAEPSIVWYEPVPASVSDVQVRFVCKGRNS